MAQTAAQKKAAEQKAAAAEKARLEALLGKFKAQIASNEERLTALQAMQKELYVAQGLNPDGTKKTATQILAEKRAAEDAARAELEASDPKYNKSIVPTPEPGFKWSWIGGTKTGSWVKYSLPAGVGAGTGGDSDSTGGSTSAVKATIVKQKTVRKTGGTVQTVNVMSDGTEEVIDEYKDYSAKDAVMAMFENTGLGSKFMQSLMDSIDAVYNDNIAPTEAQVLNSIYNSEAYKTRFSANETIRKRMAEGKGRPGDRLLKPADYIETENTFREIMANASLPTGFYDTQEDFSNFIANGVSASELTTRVNLAQSALQKADKNIVDALKNYYNLSQNDLVAYLLDKDKAFNLIEGRFSISTSELEKQYGAAEVGGMATRAGTSATKAFAEEIQIAGKAGKAEEAFQTAATNQSDYSRLLGLSGETAGSEDLVRQQLGLAGGTDVGIKTKKLASQERARFAQRSAIDTTTLGRRFKQADV
jgi:hypothetical protein